MYHSIVPKLGTHITISANSVSASAFSCVTRRFESSLRATTATIIDAALMLIQFYVSYLNTEIFIRARAHFSSYIVLQRYDDSSLPDNRKCRQ
jgi:hypothetical protein